MLDNGARWIGADASTLRTRTWDGETVVYDTRRLETHLLSPVASCVLHGMRRGSEASLDELTSLATTRLGLDADSRLREEVEAAILRLVSLGLAVRISS